MTRTAQFLELSPREARAVLRRNHVGRIAYLKGRQVDIEPLGYVARGNWLFMRSANGTKLSALAHRPYAAFEVDEVHGPFDWRSVVAHGTVYRLPHDGAPIERRQFARAVAALRQMIPETLTKHDPVPERQVVYGFNIHAIRGRRALTPSRD